MIGDAAAEVGPALFFCLLIITLSFVPVFTLEAQEGRLFAPLAFTKTYAMAAAAGLAVTLVPVLMGYLIRGRIPAENAQPAQPLPDRGLPAGARRRAALAARRRSALAALVARGDRLAADPARRRVHAAARRRRPAVHAVGAAGPLGRQGGELLQQTDRLIKTVPEVASVFGKAGPRRNRDRPGADGDVRDHDPVQAARAMARRA